MPIWRFKAGDFISPFEAMGLSAFVIRPGSETDHELSSRPGFVSRWKARRATRRLRNAIEREFGRSITWNDEGELVFAERAYGFQSIQAFAKWFDYRDLFPTFEAPLDGRYYHHPVMSGELTRPHTYRQIVDHSCYSGYYIPCDLDRVVYVEPFQTWGGIQFFHSVGSSNRLLLELEQLAQSLNVDSEYEWCNDDPLADVKASFALLYRIAKTSCEQNLPIVFDG